MSYALRTYRHRNPRGNEQEQQNNGSSFFNRTAHDTGKGNKGSSFFQAKLSVNQPGDAFEQEADAVASKVVNHSGGAGMVQQKEFSGIQRLSSSKEEEKLSTNEDRMRRDKEIQTKPEIQRMCPECEKEKMAKGNIQKQVDPKKEKEKAMMGAAAMQRKPETGSGSHQASPQLSSRIEQSAGGGRAMSSKTITEMGSSFGLDFSSVSIHTDASAADMNKELGAQAFTHGRDIYFNSGKYNPETSAGKFLLAHELTHVVQQTAEDDKSIQRMLPCPAHLNDSDPVPEGWKPYYGDSSWFHCGFRGILEDRRPSPDDPMNECFYDHSGVLVDDSHEYAGCKGTPDYYDSETSWWDHTFNDPGGIWEAGWDAWMESGRYDSDHMGDCLKACESEPWYWQPFCESGCTGLPPV